MDSSGTTEAAAEALFCEIWEGSDAWELATDSQKATTRQWVAAVLAALNLTEEHGWQLGDFTPHRYATKVLAQERIDELDAMYGQGPESKKWSSLPRQLVRRLVSPWQEEQK